MTKINIVHIHFEIIPINFLRETNIRRGRNYRSYALPIKYYLVREIAFEDMF